MGRESPYSPFVTTQMLQVLKGPLNLQIKINSDIYSNVSEGDS